MIAESKRTSDEFRQADAERKREERKQTRDITIPLTVDPARRKRAEADIFKFLGIYFPDKFTNPFTDDQRAIILTILNRAKYGGNQAIAAPRGEGKTTIAECVMMFAIVTGMLKFPVILAATGPDAKRILANVKYEFEVNGPLGEDYPEVCSPIRQLEGASLRAKMQTVDGQRTMMEWRDDHVIFPTVKGSAASGSVLSTRGLDGSIRGLRYRNLRPDFVLIDDPETRESAESDVMTRKRERTVSMDVAGLGGPGKTIATVMLCTIMSKQSIAAKYTDAKAQPAWRGLRYRLLIDEPDRLDLWQEYMDLLQAGQASGDDPEGRDAMKFYRKHRKAMDAGTRVSNKHRFVSDKLEDGTPAELSAIQHVYNLIAKDGRDAFDTEFQNDPPEDQQIEATGIDAHAVRSRQHGLPHRCVPCDAKTVTAGIDIGKRVIHYVITAWVPNARGYVIDHDVVPVHKADEIGVDAAVLRALKSWRDDMEERPLVDDDGVVRGIDVVLVDSQYAKVGVAKFIAESGAKYKPAHGYGTGHPGMKAFTAPTAKRGVMIGERWYAKPDRGVLAVHIDADHWKRRVHNGYMMDRATDGSLRDGSLSLFKDEDTRRRRLYSEHVVAEVEQEQFVRGKGVKRSWVKKSKENHWLDCTALSCVAGSIAGARLMPSTAPRRRKRKVTGGWQQ